ncbi:MAG: SGNH/GDSL hydrolase family protein [Bacteroidetes bacterium]|nr:SGNH/GDSL hydrolase family protein [Bacteroidota bacterium]
MRKLSIRIASLGLGLFIGLLMAEIVIRIVGFGGAAFSYKETKSFVGLGRAGMYEAADPAVDGVAFKMKPNTEVYNKMSTISTNSLGFRSPETRIEKPAGVFRICVVGDSFTMGDGVEQHETFSHIFDSLLNTEDAHSEVEVINMGVGGYNLIEYQNILEKRLPAYNPDLVVIGFCGRNDMNVPAPWRSEADYKPRDVENGFWRSYLVFFIKQKIIEPRRRGEPYVEGQKEWVKSSFQNIGEQSKTLDIPVWVFYLSIVHEPEYSDFVAEAALDNDLYFSTTIAEFKDKNPNDYALNLFDGHPKPEAHAMFANRLYQDITQSGILVKVEMPEPEPAVAEMDTE